MQTEKVFSFKNQASWRKWLAQNHQNAEEAWLIFYKKHSSKTGISYDEALEEALCFGWIDGKTRGVDDEKYMIRYSPRKAKSVWSGTNKEKAELLIAQGRMMDAGLAKVEEAKKNGLWDMAYTSRGRDEIPPDLDAALQEDEQARNNFHNFANSHRNNYIQWIDTAKRTQTREKRISVVVDRSRLNKKPGEQ